jgi:O-antigen ligase
MKLPATMHASYTHKFLGGIIAEQYRLGKAGAAAIVSTILVSVVGCLLLGNESVMALVAVLAIYLTLRYRNFLLYFLLASLPLVSRLIGGNIVFGYILILCQMIVWFLSGKAYRQSSASAPRDIFRFAVVFIFILTVSAFNNGISHDELLSIIRFSMNFIFLMAFYFFFDPKDILKIFIAMTIPLLLSSYFMISSFASSGSLLEFLALYRLKPAGIFTNANTFAFGLISVTPFWLALAWWGSSLKARVFSGSLSLLLLMVLFLTNSRAAFVGILVVIALAVIYTGKLRLLMAGLIATVLLLYSVPQLRALVDIALRVERGASMRGEIWSNSADIIAENWVLGVGVGNFQEAYSPYYKTAYERDFFGGTAHAHNLVISKGVELGIAGILLVLLLYYLVLRTGFSTLRKITNPDERAVVLGILGCLIALFGRSLFEGSGILDEGTLFPSLYFWMPFIALTRINAVGHVRVFSERHVFSEDK